MTDVGSSIDIAARHVRDGGVVAFPTETSYGIGASIFHPEALAMVYQIKKRPEKKPLLVLIASVEELLEITDSITPHAKKLMNRFWPGPLTILFRAREGLDHRLKNEQGQVAVRLTSHHMAQRFIKACGTPVTGTSANLSGMPPARSARDVLRGLQASHGLLAYVLDGGELPPGLPSTIVDPSKEPCAVLRAGAVSPEDILAVR